MNKDSAAENAKTEILEKLCFSFVDWLVEIVSSLTLVVGALVVGACVGGIVAAGGGEVTGMHNSG